MCCNWERCKELDWPSAFSRDFWGQVHYSDQSMLQYSKQADDDRFTYRNEYLKVGRSYFADRPRGLTDGVCGRWTDCGRSIGRSMRTDCGRTADRIRYANGTDENGRSTFKCKNRVREQCPVDNFWDTQSFTPNNHGLCRIHVYVCMVLFGSFCNFLCKKNFSPTCWIRTFWYSHR